MHLYMTAIIFGVKVSMQWRIPACGSVSAVDAGKGAVIQIVMFFWSPTVEGIREEPVGKSLGTKCYWYEEVTSYATWTK